MHARPIPAPPSANPATAKRETPLRVCIHAIGTSSSVELDALRARLPAHARIALFGECAVKVAWNDVDRVPDAVTASTETALLAAASRHFPGEHIVLVRADATLPELACERLLRALDVDGIVGVRPLDAAWRRPVPRETNSDADVATLDALCFAYSSREFVDDAHGIESSPISAWHGGRLAQLGAANIVERDALDAAGLRIVLLDHLLSATKRQARDEAANAIRATPTRLRRSRRCNNASPPRSARSQRHANPASTPNP
jgi:hypothetical protein